jgi:sugar transferase (PEP-CTERM system associated)
MLLSHIPKKKLLIALGDLLLLSTAYFLSPIIRFAVFIFSPADSAGEWLGFVVIFLFTFYLFDLFDRDPKVTRASYLFRFIVAILTASCLYIITSLFVWSLAVGRGLFAIAVVLAALLTYSWRILAARLFRYYLRGGTKLLIVGAGPAGVALYNALGNSAHKTVGFIDEDPNQLDLSHSPKVLGGSDVLEELVTGHQADEIAVAVTHLESPEKHDLLRALVRCKMQGVDVYRMSSLYEEVTGKIPVTHISDVWFIDTVMYGTKKGIYNMKVKRLLDIGFSFVALLCWGLPLLLLTCVAIKLDSKGPVFYRQKRTGARGTVFELVKFRSMTVDAEQNGAVWASKKDPRVTRVGRIIRKLRIDEVPQVWNVLKGDISFIGPRPERPEFVETLEKKIPYYGLRHSVKPGITGWAQVNYPYGASEEDALEKLQYDLFYIKNLSAFLDFHILLKTVRVVLSQKGAR